MVSNEIHQLLSHIFSFLNHEHILVADHELPDCSVFMVHDVVDEVYLYTFELILFRNRYTLCLLFMNVRKSRL